MKIKCVIVDDEKNIRKLIEIMINDIFPNFDIVGTADDVVTGIELINSKKPHLVFMDIELPDGTGFDILEGIHASNFKVIFITAYNEYAIKAFKYSAVDYILKPINIEDFKNSVNKAVDTIERHQNYSILLENINSDFPSKLGLQFKTGVEYVDTDNIIYIEGDGRYSTVHMSDGKNYIESKLLSYFEEILNKHIFLRIHKSFLINLNHVKFYNKTDTNVMMSDKSIITVSKLKKGIFFKKMTDL